MLGLIISIIIGGVAGYIAERIMKADHPIWLNVVLGIAGAFLFNIILWVLGFGGASNILGQLIAGVVGACLLIWAYRQYELRQG